jgi:hypothetical protein
MKTKLLLTATLLLFLTTVKAQIAGDWQGTVKYQGFEVEIIFHITEEDGQYATTVDIPLLQVSDYTVESTEFEDNQLTISDSSLKLSYEGTLVDDETIKGKAKYAGIELPLNLEKL